MHGISTGREGIPRREGQFRFTVPWGALISSVFDTPSFIPGAPRGIYSDYFIAALLSSTFKGSGVNVHGESKLLVVSHEFCATLYNIKKAFSRAAILSLLPSRF